MRQRMVRLGIVAALALLVVPGVFAQTTGRIEGTILDTSGAPVPGASVSVTSPTLQGAVSTTTDSRGMFRLNVLPPGAYKVKADLAGFKTVELGNVTVGIDRTVTLGLKMEVAAVVETVTVTGEAPVIDVTSTSTGINATAELFNRIPTARDFYDIARVAPGTQTDNVGPQFYGSTGAENAYIIEGLNTTGIEVGDKGKTLNFDFIQEIEVKTGGLPAEYGRTTGGVINVLTKSGGNQFQGSAFGFFEGGGLEAENSTASQRPTTTTTVLNVAHRYDFGVTLGGYLLKDKVWFFGAYDYVNTGFENQVIRTIQSPGSPPVGSNVPYTVTSNLFSGKLTWKMNQNHTITTSVIGDPTTREGAVFTVSGPASTWEGIRDFGSTDWVARYDGVFKNNFLVRAMYGKHQESDSFSGPGTLTAQSQNLTVVPQANSGGYGFYQDQKFSRDVVVLGFTKFVGSHEIKLGGDWQGINTHTENYQGGAGQRIYQFRTAAGVTYYRHRYYVDDQAPGYVRSNPSTWVIALPQIAEPNTKNLSAYLQDSWKIGRNFTLNLGVRWEQQEVNNRFGETAFKLDNNWAPRIGFAWDVKGNGKSKLYFNYGKFYENIPQDINIRAFGGEAVCFCYNFSPSQNDILPNPAAPRTSTILGGQEPVDPNLAGQYISEWLGGFEYEIAPNFALGIKGTYRNLGQVIEDFLIPSAGDYFIANPGTGIGSEMAFYAGGTAPAPKAERTNLAFEITARKNFSNGWQLLASYLWNQLEGNYDGLFQRSTGQLDPNINSAFDYADFLVNAQGDLTSQRVSQFKLDGSYQFKGKLDGLNVGLSTWWYSGLPLNAYGYSFAYGNYEYYLVPRGSLGTGPSDWEANLNLTYPIKFGKKGSVNIMVGIFNIFNRQAITQLDDRYNLSQDGFCAGVPAALCNGDGGLIALPNSTTAAGVIPNPQATATNPSYHTAAGAGARGDGIGVFTGQRSVRLGLRINF